MAVTSGRNPMSAMWSASSRTATRTSPSSTAPRSIRSVSRPGVATSRSTPLASEEICGSYDRPPATSRCRRPVTWTNGSSASLTCMASSRVGTSTSARGRRLAGLVPSARRDTSGSPNASVLPDPVRPRPSTSRPARASGMAAAWIGKGSVMPSRARRSTSRPVSPRAAKPLSSVTSLGPAGGGGVPGPGVGLGTQGLRLLEGHRLLGVATLVAVAAGRVGHPGAALAHRPLPPLPARARLVRSVVATPLVPAAVLEAVVPAPVVAGAVLPAVVAASVVPAAILPAVVAAAVVAAAVVTGAATVLAALGAGRATGTAGILAVPARRALGAGPLGAGRGVALVARERAWRSGGSRPGRGAASWGSCGPAPSGQRSSGPSARMPSWAWGCSPVLRRGWRSEQTRRRPVAKQRDQRVHGPAVVLGGRFDGGVTGAAGWWSSGAATCGPGGAAMRPGTSVEGPSLPARETGPGPARARQQPPAQRRRPRGRRRRRGGRPTGRAAPRPGRPRWPPRAAASSTRTTRTGAPASSRSSTGTAKTSTCTTLSAAREQRAARRPSARRATTSCTATASAADTASAPRPAGRAGPDGSLTRGGPRPRPTPGRRARRRPAPRRRRPR